MIDDVLKRLGIDRKSPIGDLLTPGIRGNQSKGLTVAQNVEHFREYAERAKREVPDQCRSIPR